MIFHDVVTSHKKSLIFIVPYCPILFPLHKKVGFLSQTDVLHPLCVFVCAFFFLFFLFFCFVGYDLYWCCSKSKAITVFFFGCRVSLDSESCRRWGLARVDNGDLVSIFFYSICSPGGFSSLWWVLCATGPSLFREPQGNLGFHFWHCME